MATWVAHLRIAEGLLERLPDIEAAPFAIGNLAPDAGIPDEQWKNFDPPAEVTHFKLSQDVHKEIADLDFYRRYLKDVHSNSAAAYAFRLGYFFHLVTDNLWTIQIGRPTQDRFADQFAANDKFIWEVKRDWYGLDFIYLRDHPHSLFWTTFVSALPDEQCTLDFLPTAALLHQLAYIKTFYQRTDEHIQAIFQRPYQYLSQPEMDNFIENTLAYLEQVYVSLIVQQIDMAQIPSVVDIVPVEGFFA